MNTSAVPERIFEPAARLHPEWVLREAQALTKVGSFEIDSESGRSSWSEQAAIILGLSPRAEMSDVVWEELVHPEDWPEVKAESVRCWSGEKDFDLRYRIRVEETRWKHIHGVGRLYCHEGRTKMIGTLQDVSAEVERLESERRRELQLFYAARMTQIGEIATGVAHEINNPLSILVGNITLLRKMIADEGSSVKALIDKKFSAIDRSAARIGEAIKKLTGFTTGFCDQRVESVDVKSQIEFAIAHCDYKFSNLGVKLEYVSIQFECFARCYEAELSHALISVLQNAFEAAAFSPSGSRHVKVSASRTQKLLEIVIEDSGPGVKPEMRNLIMKPFFTTKAYGTGAGLGLTLAQEIMGRIGGEVFLVPDAIRTSFAIRLPVDECSS